MIEQNRAEPVFPIFSGFPVPVPEFPGCVYPGVILGGHFLKQYICVFVVVKKSEISTQNIYIYRTII